MNGPGSSSGAKRGRPKKKPGYSREKEISKLISRAVELYQEPYDDRDQRSDNAPTIEGVAAIMKTSAVRVRKMLVTAKCFSTIISREVQALHKAGYSMEEIMKQTGLGRASVYSYLPYSKGMYKLEDPTLNAEKNRIFRERNQACESLLEHADSDDAEAYLWAAINVFAGYPFLLDAGSTFRYVVDVDEMIFADGRVHRIELEKAYRRARKIQKKTGFVRDADGLECSNAKEVYAVFLRIGACRNQNT